MPLTHTLPPISLVVVVVQSLSCVWLFATPCLQHARLPCPSPAPGVDSCPLRMPSNHLILYRPLFLPPAILPSIRVFSNELALSIRWPKYWSCSFSISPSNEYSGLFSFRIDWFGLLAVQGTLKSLLQHHNPKTSVLWCSLFFMVQPSHPFNTSNSRKLEILREHFMQRWAQ